MSLKSYALVTVDELLTSMQMTTADFKLNYLTIYNSSADASAATIVITSTGITLTVTGGANAHTTTITWAAQATVGALITAIEALSKGWVISRLCSSSMPSSGFYSTSQSCLLVANIKTVTGYNQLYLEDLINGASSQIMDYLGQDITSQAYTEYVNGSGQEKINLQRFPVAESPVPTVDIWDAATWTSSQSLTIHTDFEMDYEAGQIYKAGAWTQGNKNYRVVYTAGYTSSTMPESVKKACKIFCKIAWNKRNKEGLVSEGVSGIQTTFDTAEITAEIKGLLRDYVRQN